VQASPKAGQAIRLCVRGLRALGSPEELRLAGRISGLLYLTGAATAPALLLPGPFHPTAWVLWSVIGLAAVWGLACLTIISWERAPWLLSYLSTAAGIVLTAALMAATGGSRSPAQMYLLFVVVFTAYFYPRWEALGFIVACGITRAIPLIYEGDRAIDHGVITSMIIGFATYLVTGGAIIGGRLVVDRLRGHAEALSGERERLLAQHASLRRVATAVATSSPPRAVFTLVAAETLRLLDADRAAVVRYDGDEIEVVGTCGQDGAPTGSRYSLRPEMEASRVRATGETVRTDGYPPGSHHPTAVSGFQCCVCAPVWVDQALWGMLSVVTHERSGLKPDAEERLREFAHLVATSIANTERQAELLRRASIDELTGLANHRSFHDHLEAEVARALRHDRPLALALIDVDNLKQVNERLGHAAGDRLLIELARILERSTRKGDLLARLGAGEFGMLLPETDKRSAYAVLERARQAIARNAFSGSDRASFTAGLCDLESAGGEGSLYRLADAAMHWGKANGRNVSWIYDPSTIRQAAQNELHDEIERSHALAGLQALSRAIDAKDPLTFEHSERVAALAVRLGRAAGWEDERVALLESAALVHDVGKIGVPDAILLKPATLEPEEYEVIKQHSSLGAQIVEGVLCSEQVEWIRSHHERPDGRGYPNGLLGAGISEGAALLAMADAFDAMTVSRIYGRRKDLEEAVAECRELMGRQFTYTAVRALEVVYDKGMLSAA
jgi:diguanylate cyclase (GGDEF)-like protein